MKGKKISLFIVASLLGIGNTQGGEIYVHKNIPIEIPDKLLQARHFSIYLPAPKPKEKEKEKEEKPSPSKESKGDSDKKSENKDTNQRPLLNEDINPLLARAYLNLKKKKFARTLTLLNAAERKAPNDHRVKTMKGSTYYKYKMYNLARKEWKKSLQLNPNQPEVERMLKSLPNPELEASDSGESDGTSTPDDSYEEIIQSPDKKEQE